MGNKYLTYLLSEKNGGTSYIVFKDVFKVVFVVLVLIFNVNNIFSQKLQIMADNLEDSVFCLSKFPYDFDNEMFFYGTGTPEKSINGKNDELITILSSVKDSVLIRFSDKKKGQMIVLTIIVDKCGVVRGAVHHEILQDNFKIVKYAYDLLKTYSYTPAINRGQTISSSFDFVVKFPSTKSL